MYTMKKNVKAKMTWSKQVAHVFVVMFFHRDVKCAAKWSPFELCKIQVLYPIVKLKMNVITWSGILHIKEKRRIFMVKSKLCFHAFLSLFRFSARHTKRLTMYRKRYYWWIGARLSLLLCNLKRYTVKCVFFVEINDVLVLEWSSIKKKVQTLKQK